MKQITSILLFIFALNISAQETTFNKFYKKHKDQSAFSMNLSGSFAGSFLDDDDDKELKDFLKKSGDFKLMVFNNEDSEVSKDFKRYVRKNNLKTMARVKEKDGRVAFYILRKKDRVKEIVLRANSKEDKLVLFGIKTDMTMDELADMMSDSNLKITAD